MFPWVYEFRWDAFHITFLVVFFTIAVVVGLTFVRAVLRTSRRLRSQGHGRVSWHAAFEEMPEGARVCRHQLNGEVRHRTCDNEFSCTTCPEHQRFLATGVSPSASRALSFAQPISVSGLSFPTDRYYHRGHTWARLEADGTFTVGVDELARRMLGPVTGVELPEAGARVTAYAPAIRVQTPHGSAAFRSPMDGEVVKVRKEGSDWFLRVKMDPASSIAHLLRGSEVRPWLTRELERLQLALSDQKVGFSLADGGVPVESMPDAAPKHDWEAVWEEMFLDA
jgi:glycine cleavage system H lipoate-binding protein